MFDFVEDHREAMLLRQLLDIADRDQRVLVDRVLVKEIANDPAANFFEVREDLPEQTDFVHREERVVDSDTILHHFDDRPAGPWIVCQDPATAAETLPNCGERDRMKTRLLAMRFREGFDHVE